MYAQLQLNEDGSDILWGQMTYSTGVLPEHCLTPEEVAPYAIRAGNILDAIYAGLPADQAHYLERVRVEVALRRLIPWLTEGDLTPEAHFDFTIRTAIAFQRLPQAERTARDQRVTAIIERMLPSPKWRESLKARIDALRLTVAVVPEPVLEVELRTSLGDEIYEAAANQRFTDAGPLQDMWPVLKLVQSRLGPLFEETANVVGEVLATRYRDNVPGFVAWLQRMAKAQLMGEITKVNERINASFTNDICHADRCDLLMRVMNRWLDTRDANARQAIFDFELAELSSAFDRRKTQMGRMALDAIDAGVPLGDDYCADIRRLLDEKQAQVQAAEAGWSRADLREHLIARTAQGSAQPNDASGGVDPVHAWSLGRLLGWIEGPMAERQLDRRAIERKRREQRRAGPATPRKPAAANRPAPSTARAAAPTDEEDRAFDAETEAIIDDGLRATADFLLADVNDLLALAAGLGLPAAQRSACQHSREALARLTEADHRIDDATARDAIRGAEQAIAALRRQIKTTQADDRQRIQFDRALGTALDQEPIVLGKRHGGVIACALPMTSWGWVNDAYHGRWLFGVRQMVLDGQRVPLLPDQALALYVTGSSRSDFAFDVSVHLWQRRPGRQSPPSSAGDAQGKMNTVDWYDTYIPCAVLHVPPGK